MKNTRKFQMNGKVYESMMAIAKELGVNRVRPNQFDKYGITEITDDVTVDTQAVEEAKTNAETESEVEAKKAADVKPADDDAVTEETVEEKKPLKKVVKGEKVVKATKKVAEKAEVKKVADEVKSTEPAEEDNTLEGYSKKLKKASMDDLVKFAEEAGVDAYETVTNEQIRRMRITMALKAHFYPNEKLETKKSTGFKKVDLETLIQVAEERGLEYKKVDFPAIQRMWVTKALVDAGVTVDDLPKKDADKPEKAESKKGGKKAK